MATKTSEKSVTNGIQPALPAADAVGTGTFPPDRSLEVFRIMARARSMEERMIQMSKSGQGFFWIGGPGEEAFNVCLGLQIKKGEGPAYDYLHLHYRNSATLLAMGMTMLDGIRQMAMTATDPHSAGRNFPGHYSHRPWNVIPISSVIEIQFAMAPGTALVQKRFGGDGITVVVGGDAGTAEGDFASCMIWSTRPGQELPVLMIVMNNGWGISTPASTQHAERRIIDRGAAFGIAGEVVDGNDPVASWNALQRALNHCRTRRRPFLLEARVSRLNGHSSSSGAARVSGELDCLTLMEQRLRSQGLADDRAIAAIRAEANTEADEALAQALKEPRPQPEDVYKWTYAPSPVDAVYPGDYTGLP